MIVNVQVVFKFFIFLFVSPPPGILLGSLLGRCLLLHFLQAKRDTFLVSKRIGGRPSAMQDLRGWTEMVAPRWDPECRKNVFFYVPTIFELFFHFPEKAGDKIRFGQIIIISIHLHFTETALACLRIVVRLRHRKILKEEDDLKVSLNIEGDVTWGHWNRKR